MADSRCCRVAIGMLGSAIGKGDGDAATLTKKREERRFDEQYFKRCWHRAL
jgi:hypothetical protein